MVGRLTHTPIVIGERMAAVGGLDRRGHLLGAYLLGLPRPAGFEDGGDWL
jgi:hypothetical protein